MKLLAYIYPDNNPRTGTDADTAHRPVQDAGGTVAYLGSVITNETEPAPDAIAYAIMLDQPDPVVWAESEGWTPVPGGANG